MKSAKGKMPTYNEEVEIALQLVYNEVEKVMVHLDRAMERWKELVDILEKRERKEEG